MDSESKIPQLESLQFEDFSLDLNHFLGYDYDDISSASVELPPVIEWVNSKLQSLVEQKLVKEEEVKEVQAAVFFQLQAGLFEDRGYAGKRTAPALAHAVALEEDVKKVKREYANLVSWCQRLTQLIYSLQAKLELVRSSEATRRKVFDQNLH